MKITCSLMPTSMTGQSILVMRRPTDRQNVPSVSLQMPTDIAQYIIEAVEEKQRLEVFAEFEKSQTRE